MKQDRFLLGILIGIAVLVIVAVGVFFIRPDNLQYGEDATPEGVVHNYIVALHLKEYDKAYAYLSESANKPTLEQFSQPFLLNYVTPTNMGVDVQASTISGDRASVQMSLIYNSSDPFSSGYRNSESALLVLENSQWKILQMPSSFWYYEWYQAPY